MVKILTKAGGEALLLKTAEDGSSCLHIACKKGHLEVLKALVKVSGDAAARAAFLLKPDISNGCSCLHAASFFGHVTVVLFLLSLSCPGLVDLRDRFGRTALELAVAAGQTAAAEAIRAASGRPAPPRPS